MGGLDAEATYADCLRSFTQGLKAILHGLLISGTLPNLSLAGNKKIKYRGWQYVSVFMRRAQALRYLDLSENSINRLALEPIVGSLVKSQNELLALKSATAPAPATAAGEAAHDNKDNDAVDQGEMDEDGLPLMPGAPLLRNVLDEKGSPSSAIISLRLENCGMKAPATLEVLANAIRFSALKHISLRRNRIAAAGCVPLANIMKDYPDSYGPSAEEAASVLDPPSSPQAPSQPGAAPLAQQQSQQRPNIARSNSPALPEGPLIVSSPAGGVNRRMAPQREASGRFDDTDPQVIAAATIQQAKRARQLLAEVPRMGSLLTLDLKSNDIRGGVTFLAQALKKNRTLKVLNLSDNNLDVPALVAIADSLKYNPVLETLDVSHNPCSGPSIEGITTLRTAFTLNSNLKRLFLNDTDLPPEGAIALAEFLPEAKSLIHLDLTENFDIDIAGVMALAVSLKMNKSLRCLDINIPVSTRSA